MAQPLVLTVIGARPQFVKAAVVSHAVAADGRLREAIVHTGQHYDANMSQVFFDELGIPAPEHNLNVGSGRHGAQTARMIEGLEALILDLRPAAVLTYGDTNSTLASAVAASKLGVPIAHVEAGLRSFNRAMPEEINRILTDRVSDLLFAPTRTAVDHLLREGADPAGVMLSGDVMFDATLRFLAVARRSRRLEAIAPVTRKGYVLVTLHRAENTDDPARMDLLMQAIDTLGREVPVVFPMHPRTRAKWQGGFGPGVQVVEPVGYLDMLLLEDGARLVATDSGGVQKEAFFNAVPCVTLRTETEWVELLANGWNRLAPPTDGAAVLAALRAALAEPVRFDATASPFGDGHASERIVARLAEFLGA